MSFPDRLSNPSMVPDVSASYPVNKSVSSRLEEDLYPRIHPCIWLLGFDGPADPYGDLSISFTFAVLFLPRTSLVRVIITLDNLLLFVC